MIVPAIQFAISGFELWFGDPWVSGLGFGIAVSVSLFEIGDRLGLYK